ncbi:YqcC family protein [Modicisalibacter radicis]|uniref:YqcC family protein n=1 Tax=Halomonas sp. EAR18 TaxID=2518972 RepID=UPI00109CFBB9|nr:YqcC family protein [Halomonas sp. EAR18]
MTAHQQLDQALGELESALRSIDLWDTARPAPEAFDSAQPFCVDTMDLAQWLRYVFIARLQALVDARAPLPASCEVAPAAEAYLQNSKPSNRAVLVAAVAEVDRIVTES